MRKLLTPTFFIFLIGILSGCSDQSDCCTNYDLGITVELQNADGADMLNPSTAGNIQEQDIEMYYEVNGQLKTYASLSNGAVLDNPKGFIVQSDGSKYFLHVFSNPTEGDNVVTFIRIKERPEIKLVTKVEDDHGRRVTELRYNNQLVWANTMSSQQYPIVTVKFD
jgi:hypothetical protein